MIIRVFVALLFALGMIAGAGLAQEAEPEQPATEQPADEETQGEADMEPVEPEEAEDPSVVFPLEDVLSTLTQNDELIEFHSALLAAQLDLMFEPEQEYTVFAPTEDVFLEEAHDVRRSQDALSFYIVQGSYTFDELWEMAQSADGPATLTTIHGDEVTVEIVGDRITVGGVATITQPDIPASNGVVHIVDGLIQPVGEPLAGG